ncbi:MAG: bifunctional nuclease family protein [Bacillota bacterium]
MIQVTVERLGFDQSMDQAVVILADLSKTSFIPIWIRALEATTIAIPLEGITYPRPVTADLFATALDKFDISVTMVVISEIKDEVFHASLVLKQGEREVELDCRPSDALAIALRKGAPIYVTEKVMAEAGVGPGEATVQ